MPEYKLRIVIEGEDKASKAVDKARKSVKGLDTLTKSILKADVIRAVFTRASKAVLDFAKNATLVAARVQEMHGVLELLGERAGYSTDEIDSQVESIRNLGITTNVAQSTLAQFARYQLSAADAAKLARVAQDAAVLSMQDSSATLQQLLYAVTTYNTRVARTAGVNVQFGKSFEAAAEAAGKSVEELTEAERVQAALGAVLQEGTRIAGAYERSMDAVGKRARSVARHEEEVSRIIGGALVPAMGAAVDGYTEMLKVVEDNEGAVKRLLEPLGDLIAGFLTAGTEIVVAAEKIIMAGLLAKQARDDLVEAGDLEGEDFDFWDWAPAGTEAILEGTEALKEAGELYVLNKERLASLSEEYEHIRDVAPVAFEALLASVVATGTEVGGYTLQQHDMALALTKSVVTHTDLAKATLNYSVAQMLASGEVERAEHAIYRKVNATMRMSDAERGAAEAAERAAEAEEHRANMLAASAVWLADNTKRTKQHARAILEQIAAVNAQIAEAAVSAVSSGVDTARQIAEQYESWERDRVASAAKAALDITKWHRDQNQWIGDNTAELTEEMQAEFAKRTLAAMEKADEVKEHDADLAREYLTAEKWYQSERARIAKIEDEEARKAERGILEREYGERLQDAEDYAALERAQQEDDRKRRIDDMRAAGAAGASAFVDGLEDERDRLLAAWRAIMENMTSEVKAPWSAMIGESTRAWGAVDTVWGGADSLFDPATDSADRLLAVLIKIGIEGRAALLALQTAQTAGGPVGQGGIQAQSGAFINAPQGVPVPIIAHGQEELRNNKVPTDAGGINVHIHGNVINSPDSTDPGNIGWVLLSELRSRGVAVA